jgi:hypothetical protein
VISDVVVVVVVVVGVERRDRRTSGVIRVRVVAGSREESGMAPLA